MARFVDPYRRIKIKEAETTRQFAIVNEEALLTIYHISVDYLSGKRGYIRVYPPMLSNHLLLFDQQHLFLCQTEALFRHFFKNQRPD